MKLINLLAAMSIQNIAQNEVKPIKHVVTEFAPHNTGIINSANRLSQKKRRQRARW